MTKEVITLEAAGKEWCEFLENNDARKLIPDEEMKHSSEKDEREQYKNIKAGFDRVTRAISKGIVVIENNVITQKLQYPITGKDDGNIMLDKLVFNHRVTSRDREEAFKGLNESLTSEALIAQRRFCSRLTGVDMILLGKLDMADAKITDQIVSVFFM
jgi:hypothetical protein